MKYFTLTIALCLFGCSGEMPMVFPDREDDHFKCDMDPYKQGCERQMDYQEHFRQIKKPLTSHPA